MHIYDPLGVMLQCSIDYPTLGSHKTRPGLTGPTARSRDETNTNEPAAWWDRPGPSRVGVGRWLMLPMNQPRSLRQLCSLLLINTPRLNRTSTNCSRMCGSCKRRSAKVLALLKRLRPAVPNNPYCYSAPRKVDGTWACPPRGDGLISPRSASSYSRR